MEFMPGKPFPFPFEGRGGFISDVDLAQIHSQLVNFQWQLLQLPFEAIGQLCLDLNAATSPRLGPIFDRKLRTYGPFTDSGYFYIERAETVLRGKEGSQSPFSFRQNILLDSSCTVVGVIEREWSHTAPLQSFRPLLLNPATTLKPKLDSLVTAHDKIALEIFRHLLHRDDSHSFSCLGLAQLFFSAKYALRRAITACLNAYNWPNVRQQHYECLEKRLRDLQLLKDK
ncbi:hypothetical protein RRF57_004571 [Xylaria bambusicola]|uniref:Uncharacterized protein n=1 Tax=Xylaria bambusicola TaxID=326684 RepID=A0AAN7UP16_9PEZI